MLQSVGQGNGHKVLYSYDCNDDKCVKFIYEDIGGSDNRFSREKNCKTAWEQNETIKL